MSDHNDWQVAVHEVEGRLLAWESLDSEERAAAISDALDLGLDHESIAATANTTQQEITTALQEDEYYA